jgi:hypothetical protein
MFTQLIGLVWFLTVAVGGAYTLDHFLTLYPETFGALFPLAFVLMMTVLVVGRMLIRKALNAIKRN